MIDNAPILQASGIFPEAAFFLRLRVLRYPY